jgi:CHAT domain-containing protein
MENRPPALELHETGGDMVQQAVNRAAFAKQLLQQGKPEEALAQVSLAEAEIDLSKNPRGRVDLLRLRSTGYLLSGNYEKSLDMSREALKVLRSLGEDKGQAELYAYEGWALESTGDLPHAMACYEAAVFLFAAAGNREGEVQARIALGALYQSVGDFTRATNEYQQASNFAGAEDNVKMLLRAASFFESRGQLEDALNRYQIADSILRSANNSPLRIAIWVGLAKSHMILGHSGEALTELAQARVEAEKLGYPLVEAGVLATSGELHYWIAKSGRSSNTAEYSEALQNFNRALPMMQSAKDQAGEIGVLTDIGLVYDAQNKDSEALTFYMKALMKLDMLENSARLEEFRTEMAGQSANLYQRAILLQAREHNMEAAFELSERARARTFLDQLGNARIDPRKYTSQEFAEREKRLKQSAILTERQLQQAIARPSPELNVERLQNLRSELTMVREDYASALTELKLHDPDYASFLSISPPTLREVQQELPPEVSILSYYLTPTRTFAFVITKNSFQGTELRVTWDELNREITNFRDFAGDGAVLTSLKLLYKWLINPIEGQFRTSRLYIVPFGILHDLPFAALTTDGKKFFGDGHEISYLPSVSALPYIQRRAKPLGEQILVVASEQQEGFSHLPKANEEAEKVAALYGTKPLLGDAGSATAFLSDAQNFGIIHLIAHFDINPAKPYASSVLLNHAGEKDKVLDLSDIFGLDLHNTSLVVLSGCETQLGRRSRGDDILGLSRAFIYAGSPSVIASLWSVDDAATQLLMVAFYTHLRQGQSKAEALRTAQIELRKQYPNPYYWAGFVLTGDPGSGPALASASHN